MVECPNCRNELVGKAVYHKCFTCRECDATLRVVATSAAVPLCVLLLFIGWLALCLMSRAILASWFILIPGFRIASLFTKVEVVQKWTPMPEQTPSAREGPRMAFDGLVLHTEFSVHTDFLQEQRAPRCCIYCGVVVLEEKLRFCTNCGANLQGQTAETPLHLQDDTGVAEGSNCSCMVCDLSLHLNDPVAHCPHCGSVAHKVHLLEWLHVKRTYPTCGMHLSEGELTG